MCEDFDIDWYDIAIAGALAEEMADEERERRRQEQDVFPDDEPEP
jgi:hypothetical protein